MCATNAAIRRSLWQTHPFDEAYEAGGADTVWAGWAMSQGHRIICEPGFSVRHSHGVGWKGMLRQMRYWTSLLKPQRFDRQRLLAFRPDLVARVEKNAESDTPRD